MVWSVLSCGRKQSFSHLQESQEMTPREVVIDITALQASPYHEEEQASPRRSRSIFCIPTFLLPSFLVGKPHHIEKIAPPSTGNSSEVSTEEEIPKVLPSSPDETENGDSLEVDNETDLTVAIKNKKPKSKNSDEDDDSDDETCSKKAPSKKKVLLMTVVFASATFAAMYFKLNPVVSVPIAGLFGTNVKTFTRRVPRKPRYFILIATTLSGWGLDVITGSRFSFGPVFTSVLLSSVSRTQKLFVLGKLSKDK